MKAVCRKVELSDGSFDFVIKEDRYKAEVQKWRKDCSIVSIGEPEEVLFQNYWICIENIRKNGYVSVMDRFEYPVIDVSNAEILEGIEKSKWCFAKTMPSNPHWYCVRGEWKGSFCFNEFIQIIRTEGHDEKYRNRWYRVFYIGGYAYWTMNAPQNVTSLINSRKA